MKAPRMSERAFKYHGLGNDFVILDRRWSGQDLSAEASRELCDRHRGMGGDGVLVLLPSDVAAARMVVHNADGSVAEMCGNGLRCVVKFLADHGADLNAGGLPPEQLSVETGAGVLTCQIFYDDGEATEIEVEMGPARLISPILPSGRTGLPFVEAPLPDAPGSCGTAISMGNPHLVLFGTPLSDAAALGPRLERSEGFPERTNVVFAAREGTGLSVVVWERGVGLTEACGTGACAAVAAGVKTGRLEGDASIRVALPGGVLHIRVAADLSAVQLRGPATFVFEAVVDVASDR